MVRARRRLRSSRSVVFLQSGAAFAADAQVHASIARHLPEHGYRVAVACNPGTSEHPAASSSVFATIPDVRMIPTVFGPSVPERRPLPMAKAVVTGAFGSAISLVRLTARLRRDDVAIVHCTEKAREAMFGYAVSRLVRAHLVIHLHVGVDDWFSAPTRWVMHRADRLLAISEYVGQTAVDEGYDPAQVAVALNGASPHAADVVASPDDAADVRAELGLAADTLLVSIVARLNPWKGHRQLFEAFALVLAARPADAILVVLLVVGSEGTAGERGPVTTELRALVGSLGISDHVRFLGFRRDATRLISASDVFAMPSMEEPFGLVFLEAMTAGKPVVGQRSGGTPEVVVDGSTGLLAEPDDVDELAAHLTTLLDDPAERERMGAAGRERAETLFSAERMAADVARVYDSMLGK